MKSVIDSFRDECDDPGYGIWGDTHISVDIDTWSSVLDTIVGDLLENCPAILIREQLRSALREDQHA